MPDQVNIQVMQPVSVKKDGTVQENSNNDPAANVLAELQNTDIDITTYDNQGTFAAVVAGVNIQSGTLPVGCTKALVSYFNPGGTTADIAWLRWGAAAVTNSGMAITSSDNFVMKVPTTGTRKLNVIGNAGVTAGTIVTIYPL